MPERVDYGPLLTLLAEQVPDADARRRILWDTPVREFGLGSAPQRAAGGPG
jgi:hypothetical protein